MRAAMYRLIVTAMFLLLAACQSGFREPNIAAFPYFDSADADAVAAELLALPSTIRTNHRFLLESHPLGLMPEWQEAAQLDPELPFVHDLSIFAYQYLDGTPFGYYLRLEDGIATEEGEQYDVLLFTNWQAMRRDPDTDYAYVDIDQALRAGYPGALEAAALLHFNHARTDRVIADTLLTELETRARGGSKPAIGLLANVLSYGLPMVPKDTEAGIRWAELGSALNEPNSLYARSLHYRSGLGVAMDEDLALDYLLRAAELGHQEAAYRLGMTLMERNRETRDYSAGMFWLQQAAQDGNLNAQKQLGYVHMNDQWGLEDRQRAVYWWYQAATGSDSQAQLEIAVALRDGNGVETDRDAYLYWLQQSAIGGNATAQYDLSVELIHWDSDTPDYEAGLPWLVRSADQGFTHALATLASMFFNGNAVEADEAMALELYRAAAELGHPQSMSEVGWFYHFGRVVDEDLDTAADWYRKALEAGEVRLAHTNLGSILWDTDRTEAVRHYITSANLGNEATQADVISWFVDGDYLDISVDDTIKWLKVGAEQGNVVAMRRLAMVYNAGMLLERNEEEFLKYAHMAAEGGDAETQMVVAIVYGQGRGVEQDFERAQYWLEQSVAQQYIPAYVALAQLLSTSLIPGEPLENDARAQALLDEAAATGDPTALMLQSSRNASRPNAGGPIDFARLESAAKSGTLVALVSLAIAYYEGNGTEQDLERAYSLGLQAAERGHGAAQHLVGKMYDFGEGVEKDPIEAYKWISLAARFGYPPAAAYLPDLADVMSETQIGIAERRAQEWITRQAPAANGPSAAVSRQ